MKKKMMKIKKKKIRKMMKNQIYKLNNIINYLFKYLKKNILL